MCATTTIIAEAGVNHNGSIEIATKMIEVAANAGADCVKFQTFIPSKLVSRYAQKAEYQVKNTGNNGTQLNMLKSLQLPYEGHITLHDHCKKIGIVFLSAPFDLESIDFLETFDIPFWKIPSGEITNYPYLVRIAKTGKDIVMSTGMSTIADIQEAINTLRENGSGKISLLHCNTEYPTPFSDVNLRAMETLRERFRLDVGYSDHTIGIEMPIAAVAVGASIIEKHFTLDHTMEGPDHKSSLEPQELKTMVQAIRNIEVAMGTGIKAPTVSEEKNIAVARKSIVAKCRIREGDFLTQDNITTKRPGSGLSPMLWNQVIGMKALHDFNEDELIEV